MYIDQVAEAGKQDKAQNYLKQRVWQNIESI